VTGDRSTRREAPLEAAMVAAGSAIRLETRGRISGQPRGVTIGFVREPAGTLLVAASSEDSHWARNLLAEARCHVELGGSRMACRATPLAGAEAHGAVRELILKYGTPAERLGGGPAFRLHPDRGTPR
jgi:deazaflavin-dependent oxidoreductase (nitroreductase family)